MRQVLFLMIVFFFSSVGAEMIPGFGGTKNQPIKITAEELAIDQNAKQALFSGKVKAAQADITMTSLRMSLIYDDKKQKMEPKFIYASGDVALVGVAKQGKSAPVARSRLAEYNMETKKLILIGGVVLERDGQVLHGQSLTVDLVSGLSQFDSTKAGKAGRIRGVFTKQK
jgi:lipopolysaccharide export system protein LptA